jgi:hypothetical protein
VIHSGKEHEVRAMENGGNFKVNSIFEARLPSQDLKPTQTADGRTRERYIRDKYERRKYFDPSGYSNVAAAPIAAAPQSAPAPHVVGPPSDAAKKRLEQQRARKAKDTPPPPRAPPQPAPAPASAPVDLLDLFALEDAPSGPSQHDQVQQDMSKSMSSLGDFLEADKKSHLSRGVSELTKATAPKQQQQAGVDIMSLYNRANSAPQAFANFGDPNGMQMPQQPMNTGMMGNHGGGNNMMGNHGGGGNNMMMNNHSGGMSNGSMPMMGGNAGNPVQHMTQMMQNMHMQPQQQQQQQQMMMMTPQQQQHVYQQMMMMQQQQQMYQQMMMMQQQQQQTPAAMPTQQSSAKKASPEKKDPFAHFAAF